MYFLVFNFHYLASSDVYKVSIKVIDTVLGNAIMLKEWNYLNFFCKSASKTIEYVNDIPEQFQVFVKELA